MDQKIIMQIEDLIYVDKNAFDGWISELKSLMESCSNYSWWEAHPEFFEHLAYTQVIIKTELQEFLEEKDDEFSCRKIYGFEIVVVGGKLEKLKKYLDQVPLDSYCTGKLNLFWQENLSCVEYKFSFRKA